MNNIHTGVSTSFIDFLGNVFSIFKCDNVRLGVVVESGYLNDFNGASDNRFRNKTVFSTFPILITFNFIYSSVVPNNSIDCLTTKNIIGSFLYLLIKCAV